MSLDELRCEWRRLYERDPPRISRDLLILGIGYATRLFLERKIEGVKDNPNWTSQRILEREWWVISWKDVPASLPWTAILCAHLRALA